MNLSFQWIVRDLPARQPQRDELNRLYAADEAQCVDALLAALPLDRQRREQIHGRARDLVARVRERKTEQGALEAFMQEYDLSSEEGVVLMCLAEALLRIPDDDTAEALIADKLADANWESHLGRSSSLFVNASTWGLMLTGRLVRVSSTARRDMGAFLGKLANKSGEPVVRLAIRQAMRIMGHQFVMGRDIQEAMKRAGKRSNRDYRYSYDMLGEAALTARDAERYLTAYREAIEAIGRELGREIADNGRQDIFATPSISVKLSALHPRYEPAQRERVLRELGPRLLELAQLARANGIGLTMDAEEAERLLLSLDVFARVARDPSLAGWDGLGLAVQAYQKRAPAVLDWLADLARDSGRRLPVRLVKGAYWDAEIKYAQAEGHSGYPVFTRKANTDLSYLVCAHQLLRERHAFYPQFATHNAHTIAAVQEMAGDRLDYEFQRLHGMGEDLYGELLAQPGVEVACRVYAPVGSHEDLLPYLVRRLLENGANTSFVNRIVDESLPLEEVARDPVSLVEAAEQARHPRIPLPVDIYGPERRNARGINLAAEDEIITLARAVEQADPLREARPLLARESSAQDSRPVLSPADGVPVGEVTDATLEQVDRAIGEAAVFAPQWDRVAASERAAMLRSAADRMEAERAALMRLLIREAGKTVPDAVAELREAVDFCRYYANHCERLFGQPVELPGPTGERNTLQLHGRGVFACISPWNFPLAIFTGQVVAALAAGNTVLAKPAEQTPLVAAAVCHILYQAGVPRAALQLLPGDGATVGSRLSTDPRIDGVAFTGSTETARRINRSLAERDAPLASLIAETGGQNAMLIDSSALPEQVVGDVVQSAFLSAGQRCSALRVMYVQRDIADRVTEMLAGAMDELVMGDPRYLDTDVGPVIDGEALAGLQAHANWLDRQGGLIATAPGGQRQEGHYFAPRAYRIDNIDLLEQEVFGPLLHVIPYRARDLDQVIEAINRTGYGLTLGIHSRIERTQRYIAERVRVGNCYVNRNMVGAVVGVQPFGGEGLSGTGPKAGGPHYLLRFATERTLTVNTAAVGGNASLLAMGD